MNGKSRKKNRYVVKKYDGDDSYSYAIFRTEDVTGLNSPIFYGEATPVLSGMRRSMAQQEARKLNNKEL